MSSGRWLQTYWRGLLPLAQAVPARARGTDRNREAGCVSACPGPYAQRFPYTSRGEVTVQMTTVRVKDGESIEAALKRFKKATEKAGILSEIRKREHYEKPSVKKKKKSIAAKKRAVKKNKKF